jgi:serine/threonine protein kinase
MTPQRWQQIREIFEAALEHSLEDREGFLARASGDDEALHREVISLLASHEEAEGFIESPPHALAANLFHEKQQTDRAGLVLGHYRLLSPIGKGGMGEVWLAHDQELGRKAAVKLLPLAHTTDEERVRRFEREARATSALNHPNILVVFEIGRSERGHYIAAEFVEGETLRDAMRRRSLGLVESLDVAAQVCGALSAAHGAGVVHRDIKPENLMLRPDGYVKVLDFGLAKLTEPAGDAPRPVPSKSGTTDTTPGLVLGTASYMSPEQARGVLAVQEEIAEEISDNLRLKLSPEERQRLTRHHNARTKPSSP